MKSVLIASLLLFLFAMETRAETIKLGRYSGQPGYFVRIGKGDQDVLNAVAMSPEALAQLSKLALKADINQTRDCEVEGAAQSIGYTIFAIKSCR